jgi:hypothetical protein
MPESFPGLSKLSAVALTNENQARLEMAMAGADGDAAWRGRKRAEAHDLLALAQIAPPGRMEIGWMDSHGPLRALLALRVPVPCRPGPNQELKMRSHVVLGLTYRWEAVHYPLPGATFFQLLEPADVWHANVGPLGGNVAQALCLGPTLPASIKCVNLVLMAYGALSMQTIQIDEKDPAGVLHVDAARWWAQNLHRIPLSATPFLRPDPAEDNSATTKGADS